jgi:hypothetical protein
VCSRGKRPRKVVLSYPKSESPANMLMFQRLILCTVEGKVRESFVMAKKSKDPIMPQKLNNCIYLTWRVIGDSSIPIN